MKTFKYDITTRQKDEPLKIAELDLLGSAGWELVAVVSNSMALRYHFKKVVE